MARSQRRARERAARKGKGGAGSGESIDPLNAWERLPPRIQHAIAIGFLLLVTLGFFWPVTFGGKTMIGGDIIQWRGMAEAMLAYEEATGDRALWAPNGFSGMPGFLIHYPKEVFQVDRVLAFVRNLGWWPGAHFFTLLLGMYVLVTYLSRDALAGALGAIAFGLTTYIPIILTAGHNTKFIALAFAPWLVFAFMYALRRPPNGGWLRLGIAATLFAVILSANLRAEHVQITYYVSFALGIVWIAEAIGAYREQRLMPFVLATGALLVGSILAILMVAHPYMATAEYKAFTIRGVEAGGLSWEYAMNWSQGFGELVTLLIPNAYGSDGLTYWGPKPFTAGPHYIGGIVLLLAAVGVLGVRRPAVRGMGVAVIIMLLLSLGEHLPILNRPMYLYFPLFDAFRVPETWISVVSLMVAVLAGAGLYYLGRREPTAEGERRKSRNTYGGLIVLGGLVVVLLLGRDVIFSFESPGELERLSALIAQQAGVPMEDPRVEQTARSYLQELQVERRSMFNVDAFRAIIFLLLGGLAIVLTRIGRIPAWSMQAMLLLLVTVDLWQVDRRYFNEDSPAIRPSAPVERFIPQFGVDRFIQTQVEVAGGSGHFRTLPLALNPFNDGRTPFFYESVGGYHGAKLALYQDYIDHLLFRQEGGFTPHGLDLTATRFVISRGPIGGMEVVFQDEQAGLLVLEIQDAMPRAWFVDDYEVLAEREEVLGRLVDPAFNPRTTVILPGEPELPAAGPPTAIAAQPTVNLIRFTPREILWEVETDRPRLFVASEVYYPAGWVARVGGEETSIYQANHFLRAVVIPEGQHHLSMRFEPAVHRRSLLIASIATLITYLGLFVMVGMAWYRRGEDA